LLKDDNTMTTTGLRPPRLARTRGALALVLALGTLILAVWIVLPAPTYFFLTYSVGAVEVSAWLLVASLVALALAWPDARTRTAGASSGGARMSAIAFNCAAAAFALAASPYLRFPATARQFDGEMNRALGGDALRGLPDSARRTFRARPLVVRELFAGIRLGGATVARGVRVAAPDGVQLTVDIYRPAAAGTYPIVVQIYGGAWQRGSPASNGEYAHWLAARGYVVFAIDYRHAPVFHFPAQLEDVRTDLAWIRDHAAEYGGDTARVAFLGRSAGGHLAMLAAYTAGPLAPKAVVSLYGGIDLVGGYEHPPRPDPLDIRDVEEKLIGGTPAQFPGLYREGTVLTYVTHRQPATLLIYAGRDNLVEAKYGALLRDRLAATGTTVAYLEIPWANHAFDEVLNGPSDQLAMYHTERFLAWALNSHAPG
jgi:acetyl esterase/lipase